MWKNCGFVKKKTTKGVSLRCKNNCCKSVANNATCFFTARYYQSSHATPTLFCNAESLEKQYSHRNFAAGNNNQILIRI